MANGLLSEIRRIAESSKDIPQEVVNRLMLSALAELVVKVDKHAELEEVKHVDFDTAVDDMKLTSANLTAQVTEMNAKLTLAINELAALRSNPFIALGGFIKRHPKSSLIVAIIFASAVLVLVTSRPFMVLLLSLLGVPDSVIEQLLILLNT